MLMFLMIAFMSLFGLAVMALAASSARMPEERRGDILTPQRPGEPRFFGGGIASGARSTPIPVDVLIREIERHVRLEQAAAESFLEYPAAERLYSEPSIQAVH